MLRPKSGPAWWRLGQRATTDLPAAATIARPDVSAESCTRSEARDDMLYRASLIQVCIFGKRVSSLVLGYDLSTMRGMTYIQGFDM